MKPSVAVVIPCLNEGQTIAKVVSEFKQELPEANIYVFNNASIDQSALLAEQAGAQVRLVNQRGKGFVVQAFFEQIDADIVIMVDGDDTYPSAAIHELVDAVWNQGVDMAVGTRLRQYDTRKSGGSFRPLHFLGNRCIVWAVNILFGVHLEDILSGYRAFSRRFMISMPVLSGGFEIETELTVHAITHAYHIKEIPIHYGVRPSGSLSKLNTWKDGYRIIRLIFLLFKNAFPLRFFFIMGVLSGIGAVIGGEMVFQEFEHYHRIIGVARAVGVVGLGVVSFLCFGIGLILDVVNQRAKEAHRLHVQTQMRLRHKICTD